jgi:hypothetical protein
MGAQVLAALAGGYFGLALFGHGLERAGRLTWVATRVLSQARAVSVFRRALPFRHHLAWANSQGRTPPFLIPSLVRPGPTGIRHPRLTLAGLSSKLTA